MVNRDQTRSIYSPIRHLFLFNPLILILGNPRTMFWCIGDKTDSVRAHLVSWTHWKWPNTPWNAEFFGPQFTFSKWLHITSVMINQMLLIFDRLPADSRWACRHNQTFWMAFLSLESMQRLKWIIASTCDIETLWKLKITNTDYNIYLF